MNDSLPNTAYKPVTGNAKTPIVSINGSSRFLENVLIVALAFSALVELVTDVVSRAGNEINICLTRVTLHNKQLISTVLRVPLNNFLEPVTELVLRVEALQGTQGYIGLINVQAVGDFVSLIAT